MKKALRKTDLKKLKKFGKKSKKRSFLMMLILRFVGMQKLTLEVRQLLAIS